MPESPFPVELPEGDHFLRDVSEMAERCAVVAQDAIYSASGIKLIDKGARVDSRLYDRLVQHKLRDPVDQCLAVENAVDGAVLAAAARDLAAQDALVQLFAEALGAPDRLFACLRQVPLPAPVAFKLTVMRERRPAMFEHALRITAAAMFLAIRSGLDSREHLALTAAALLHDVGTLHMDPAWEDPHHRFVGPERRHLAAHPITSMLVVREAQVYSRASERAVLEHHERMDGTGYPRGLTGAAISPMGQILLLAEVVAAFYEKFDDIPAQRLSLVLRLNHRKFPGTLVAHLLPLLQEESARESALMPLGADASEQIERLAEAFTRWQSVKDALAGGGVRIEPDSAFAFCELRLQALQKTMLEAGSHPRQQADILPHLAGDAMGLAEVGLIVREGIFQLRNIANGCQRRWPQLARGAQAGDAEASAWCDWVLDRF